MYNFGPAAAGERFIFGAQRPGYFSSVVSQEAVQKWIQFMKGQGIQRVCCLLDQDQLAYYPDGLLEIYREAFGVENVCHAPVADYTLIDPQLLLDVALPFLKEARVQGEKVVVHCSGGVGRTGHVLACWLVYDRGLAPEGALAAVRVKGVDRDPVEAVHGGMASKDDLLALLESCRRAGK